MAEVEALKELVTAGQAALQIAEGQMGHDFGDERTFANMLAVTRFKSWLKRYVEDGKEVVRRFSWEPDNNSGSWLWATPEEIADGEFLPQAPTFTAPMASRISKEMLSGRRKQPREAGQQAEKWQFYNGISGITRMDPAP